MKNVIVYLDRDNEPKIVFEINNKVVSGGIITKAEIDIPDSSFVDGVKEEISTDTGYMMLLNNETEASLNFFGAPILVGRHYGRITVYDSANPNGLAWDDISIDVRNWEI